MAKNEDPERISLSASQPTWPTITLPPRPSMEALFTGGFGASPGAMTLVSRFFSEIIPGSEYSSFSQLLAGAMASPLARPTFFTDNSIDNSSKGGDFGSGFEKSYGFKQSRPMNLVVARSPLFTAPPGWSPSALLNYPTFFPPQSPFGMSHLQALAQVTAQAAIAQSQQLQAEHQSSSLETRSEPLRRDPSFTPDEALEQPNPKSSVIESDSDRKCQPPSAVTDRPTDDGYNWRKYGQKQVKGSEYPRSYYKCTHVNCPVKKKVERSPDGQITEIICKGQHSHEMPQPSRRSKDSSDPNGNINSQAKPEFGSSNQAGHMNRSLETVDLCSMPQRELETTQTACKQLPGSIDTGELADAEIREAEVDNDKPNAKRRNVDMETSEVALSHKTVTESKIIVQTRSEVDLLDDGYRWRKYGQKVVKGHPYPRSYYKCTSARCNVRKHVERAAADPKAVITTYDGKHSHDIPAARNCSHNLANNNAGQLKPIKVVAEKHQLLKEMELDKKDQRPVLLQLKEEQITV